MLNRAIMKANPTIRPVIFGERREGRYPFHDRIK